MQPDGDLKSALGYISAKIFCLWLFSRLTLEELLCTLAVSPNRNRRKKAFPLDPVGLEVILWKALLNAKDKETYDSVADEGGLGSGSVEIRILLLTIRL